ncbi:MAG: prolipoprotein diacylglyceryl transferase family protein [Mucilaginibacter sp.]
MGTLNNTAGKVLYGLIFTLVLPVCLYLWARSTAIVIQLPVPDLPAISIILLAAGAITCLWGMASLILYGKGLPMNAYPPKFYVYTGIYAVLHHPIYFASGMISFGLSLYFKSSSGFWLVSPLFCLAMVAYVAGFENENIKSSTGYFDHKVFFSLPGKNTTAPTFADRLKVFVLAFIPWLIIYELFIFAGVPTDAIFTNLAFEKHLLVIEWSELFYVLPYLMVAIIPFLLNTQLQVRRFIQDIWWAMFFVFFIYLAFPLAVHQREFTPTNFLGHFIYWERSNDGEVGALPAFHVVWAFLIAKYFSTKFGLKRLWQVITILIALSCIANGSHSVPDVIGGYMAYLLVSKRHVVWNNIRHAAESIANSWKEWHWGQVRLINHGLYAGAGGFAGMLIVNCCLGKDHAFAGFIVGISSIIGAALWAQVIEGSPKLLRPYGYYGSLVGGIVSSTLLSLFYDIDLMYLLAAYALAAPWFQMLGRLRCLVQGCCHGKPCAPVVGIRFTDPHSRVLKIASLKGIPIHPTQLYSIGSNLLIALLLLRLFSLQMPVSFITGIYFILNGLARFVEEALRGEPQTAYWKGLRIYQWLALISIVAGAVVTSIPAKQYLSITFYPNALVFAFIFGLFATAAYGMDFPRSNKRFARLTS